MEMAGPRTTNGKNKTVPTPPRLEHLKGREVGAGQWGHRDAQRRKN